MISARLTAAGLSKNFPIPRRKHPTKEEQN
jgi:hypothetical protein